MKSNIDNYKEAIEKDPQKVRAVIDKIIEDIGKEIVEKKEAYDFTELENSDIDQNIVSYIKQKIEKKYDLFLQVATFNEENDNHDQIYQDLFDLYYRQHEDISYAIEVLKYEETDIQTASRIMSITTNLICMEMISKRKYIIEAKKRMGLHDHDIDFLWDMVNNDYVLVENYTAKRRSTMMLTKISKLEEILTKIIKSQ